MSTAMRMGQPVHPAGRKHNLSHAFNGESAGSTYTAGFAEEQEERIEVIFNEIHFCYYRSAILSQGAVCCNLTEQMISFVFFVAGSGSLIDQHKSQTPVSFKERQHALFFASAPEIRLNTHPGKRAEVFIINLSISFFSQLLRADHPLRSALKEHAGNRTLKQAVSNSVVTPRMVALLYSMLQSEHQGEYNQLFFQSRVMELLILQLEQSEKDNDPGSSISSEDKQRMLRAKELIESNLSSPCSIIDLAQLVGTNDCYLKKHFKQAFGTTIYGYLQQKRMEKAKALLLEGTKKMTEIARSVGYKHASHFSTAFKKHFGYQPNKIRVLIASFLFESDIWSALI
ncbi:AraC family transcriptional regulator [Terrimonas sp. NA20]|uniref:AraC family transcriptional regulator n=1 Tax=Terrimonas ginsenosidimutans TaxID=2908004 RepID=A0ABS9KPM9_9BACT|nr:AraC family transcriptional regulator [Terrimonas ginsenosidimutans]MCG2614282.1 AraC family transcriptional regulator [Terrimonas ginsenosidimutans]